MNRALHPRANVGRLYASRGEGGRSMILIEECMQGLKNAACQNTCMDGDTKLHNLLKDKAMVKLSNK